MKQLFKRLTGSVLALVLLLSSMPQSLTAIENCAFDGCASLNGLQFPAQLTSVGVSATGFLPMVAHYAFRPDAAVDRMQLRFSLPTQPELQTTSITLDGVTARGEVAMHLMLAAYDPDGRMCAMIDGDLTIEPGGTGFKSLTYTAEQQVNTVKIFLVDPGTMEPPGSVFTITDAAPAIKAA